jgi:hypothetical protein
MVADSEEELHAFAESLGLKREWFQNHGRIPHYDVTDTKRAEAITAGALPISSKELVRMFRKKES